MKTRAIVAALLLAAACGKGSATSPGGAGGRLLRSLTIEGPASIAPGATVQLRLIGVFMDGTQVDLTARAAWSSSESGVVALTPNGSATGGRLGESTIQAEADGGRVTRALFVLPPNTWKILGSVTHAGFAIDGARVDVVSGTGAGASATTNASGLFALFGVAGALQLRVTADRYVPGTRDVSVSGHEYIGAIVLQSAVAPIDISGAWTVEIEAAGSCSMLPAFARRRSYAATAQQTGTFVRIVIEGANLVSGRNTFTGRIAPDDHVRFELTEPYYNLPAIAEMIDFDQYTVGGVAAGRAAASSITATLHGEIAVFRSGQPRVVCFTQPHQLRFVRRTT